MQQVHVDGLNFEFPDEWALSKYDDWSFYNNRFKRILEGIKALDLLAVSPSRTAWLIEVKDYRIHQRTKPSDLADEVAKKALDTLAAMLPAKIYAPDSHEKEISSAIIGAKKLCVVLHLEQPLKTSKLRPRAIDVASVEQKLRKILKPVDAHPKITESTNMRSLAWTII